MDCSVFFCFHVFSLIEFGTVVHLLYLTQA